MKLDGQSVHGRVDVRRAGLGLDPGAVLFIERDGFYEAFFDDAQLVAGLPGMPVEQRFTQGGARVPVVSIPRHKARGCFRELANVVHALAIIEDITLPSGARRTVVRKISTKAPAVVG